MGPNLLLLVSLIITKVVFSIGQTADNICQVTTITSARQVVSKDGNTVMCDTATDGGGWILIQRRVNGNVNFYRNWLNYTAGFGYVDGDHWLGLDNLHHLCETTCDFRVDFAYRNKTYFSQYTGFSVAGEVDKFRLRLATRLGGNVRDDLHAGVVAGDGSNAGYGTVNGVAFSTYDNDQDNHDNANCAADRRGGWWWNNCASVNLNGLWGDTDRGMYWSSLTAWRASVQWSELKVRVSPGVDWSLINTGGLTTTDFQTLEAQLLSQQTQINAILASMQQSNNVQTGVIDCGKSTDWAGRLTNRYGYTDVYTSKTHQFQTPYVSPPVVFLSPEHLFHMPGQAGYFFLQVESVTSTNFTLRCQGHDHNRFKLKSLKASWISIPH